MQASLHRVIHSAVEVGDLVRVGCKIVQLIPVLAMVRVGVRGVGNERAVETGSNPVMRGFISMVAEFMVKAGSNPVMCDLSAWWQSSWLRLAATREV